MIRYAFTKLKERKYIIQGIIFTILFLGVYFVLDYLNYREAEVKPTTIWFLVNVPLNIIMAIGSMLLMNLSTIMVEMKAGSDKSSHLGFISVLFGIFTYGCTSCVVLFLSVIGITFSPTIFPFIDVWYGIIYKLLSLALILLGFYLVLRNINKGVCKVKIKKNKDVSN